MRKSKEADLDTFRRKCREHNLSMTPQRLAIYKILKNADNHPSAEEVFNQVKADFPDMSIDTVYRTLTTFSEIGVIRVVEGYSQARRYDPDMESHHHFRCMRCDRIIDFHEKSFDKLKIPSIIKDRYMVCGIKVILEGVCDQCSKK